MELFDHLTLVMDDLPIKYLAKQDPLLRSGYPRWPLIAQMFVHSWLQNDDLSSNILNMYSHIYICNDKF